MKNNKFIGLLILCFVNNHSLFGQENIDYDFINLQWLNNDVEITEAHIYDKVIISFETQNIPNDEIINIEIWENSDNILVDLIGRINGIVKNGKVDINWIVEYDEENENSNYFQEIQNNGYTILDYVFIIKYNNIEKMSKLLAIMDWIDQKMMNADGVPLRKQDYVIFGPDGELFTGKTNKNGRIILKNLRKIGKYRFFL